MKERYFETIACLVCMAVALFTGNVQWVIAAALFDIAICI